MTSASRYDRASDIEIRQKTSEERLAEATTNLEALFNGEKKLQVTKSESGAPRVRAHIPDEDGYAGWVEGTNFTGIAQIEHQGVVKYVAERHFPHLFEAGQPTYFWEFTPSTGELLFKREEAANDTPTLDMTLVADDEHEGYFLRATQDLASSPVFSDYEHGINQRGYTFQLPELQ